MENKKMKITSEGVFKSGVKGITWEKNIDTWRAEVNCNGKNYILGFNPNLYELIPLMEKARVKIEEGEEAFLDFYENEIGRKKREVIPCPFQSDVAGVSYNMKTNKWVVAISIENRKYTLGYFEVQEDAESLRKEADKIKSTCETTITESGIIDYTPLYEFLEKLRIEKQQSRLDARIGTGHGKRAWKRYKKEEHELDKLLLKSLKGELQKELRGYNKAKKETNISFVSDYPTIKYTQGSYYVFVKKSNDDNEIYVGKTLDLLHAILLYELANEKVNTSTWTSWYECEIDMGLKVPTIDDILDYFDLSRERYNKMKSIISQAAGFNSTYKKETFENNIMVYSRDYRPMILAKPNSENARLVFAGVTMVMKDNVKLPIKGFSMKLEPNEKVSLSNDMIEDLYDFEEVTSHLESGDFWTWYLFESGIFANMENVIIKEENIA